MKRTILSILILFWISASLFAAEPQVAFEEKFDTKLGDGWTWLRENPNAWRIRDGGLEIRVEPGLANNVKNALLRPAPARSKTAYAIEATVTFTAPPTNQYEQAGITWYQKGKPVFKLVHEHIDGKEYIIPGKVPASEKTVRLRLVMTNDSYTAQFQSAAKGEFKTVASGKLAPSNEEQISIQCYNGPADAEHWMRFQDFRIAEVAETPTNTAIVPVPKLENDSYDWYARHEAVLKIKDQINPEIVMIGDSITHFWAGPPDTRSQNGPLAWKRLFGQRRVLNLGFGWDRTQNVLWRLAHGEFDGLHPRYVVINIGTNNFSSTSHARANTPAEVAEGIRAICTCIHAKSPESRIILMGVFPRGAKPDDPFRAKILELNKLLAEVGKGPGITVLDIGQQFLLPNGELPRKLMSDFCHPTEDGYVIWASALRPLLQ